MYDLHKKKNSTNIFGKGICKYFLKYSINIFGKEKILKMK
jgi:hypothetical protein